MLTEPGWPRPVIDGQPIPWAADSDNLAQMDPDRHKQAMDQGLCQVCGGEHTGMDWAYLFVKADTEPVDKGALLVLPIDDAVLHERCFDLTVDSCPGLRRHRRAGVLIAYRARVADVDCYDIDDFDDPRLAVLLARCEPVALT